MQSNEEDNLPSTYEDPMIDTEVGAMRMWSYLILITKSCEYMFVLILQMRNLSVGWLIITVKIMQVESGRMWFQSQIFPNIVGHAPNLFNTDS